MEKKNSPKWSVLIAVKFIVWGLIIGFSQPNTVWYWLGAVITAGLSEFYVHRHEENGEKNDGYSYFRFRVLMGLTVARCIGWLIRG